jgi:hypothetical protein
LSSNFRVSVITRKSYTSLESNSSFKGLNVEFQNHLDNSDYVFYPKGFGNYSSRFYECLSAGVTPIIIDIKKFSLGEP